MRNAGGYGVIFGPPSVAVEEHDTFTCHHCQRVVIVKARCKPEDLGGHCKLCDELICPECVNEGGCSPFEKQLEQSERRQDALRSYGLA